MFKLLSNIAVCIIFLVSCSSNKPENNVNYNAHTFYYNWYATPQQNTEYKHWNHQILAHWSDTTWNNAGGFPGGESIGANFYPSLGCYSSTDSSIIDQHMQMMKRAAIGTFVITWLGKDSFEGKSIPLYLHFAQKYGLKVVFHMEPFYKTVEEFRAQVEFLNENYNNHPAIFKHEGKPFYYVYDSYKLKATDWETILSPSGKNTVRNTPLDATFIGLWVQENEGETLVESGFDGFYTYFASEGFVYGSTTSNWKTMRKFASHHNLIFIPCVGPGYHDTRIRPWNAKNTKTREAGAYYERMFTAAVQSKADFIGITSFNEWHEGTQIEPSVAKQIKNYIYDDFGQGVDPNFYLDKTRELITRWKK